MISRIFIERPRFAIVIAIVTVLAGLVAIGTLPIAQYPNITPGQVSISANYPGADAATVMQTVVQPLEAQINGVKKMLYLSSTATDTGSATITATFDIGTDGDLNTVNTQNRVSWADAQLPEEVKRQTVIVKEKSSGMLAVVALYSPQGGHDALFLNNYATIYLKDELARIPGVGDVTLLGELKYAMRVWLDADKLAYLKMSVNEVLSSVKSQNVQVSAGSVGDKPGDGAPQYFRFALQTQGRLTSAAEFGDIVVRAAGSGTAQVKLKDIARIELAAESYHSTGQFNGQPAAIIAIYQLNDANGIAIVKACRAKLEELKGYFPDDLEYRIPFDTTDFIVASIDEVYETLYIAVLLVVLVTWLFLQDWRATLVPTIAIPVSLIGTFAIMAVIGYSINLITLFGLILAIGIVVDDAIVVIENVNRLMEEEHLSPHDAAIKSMEQVTGPVIATTAVLLAMFVPICFLPGITGEIYRQFGVTISVAVALSTVNALTLSPALSAILLKPATAERRPWRIFGWFNAGFEKLTLGYGRVAAPLLKRSLVMLLFYALLTVLCLRLFSTLPTGFIPDEDQAKFFVTIQLPDAAGLDRTDAVCEKVRAVLRNDPAVVDVLTVSGFNLLTGSMSSSNALFIVRMTPWSARPDAADSQDAVIARIRQACAMPEATVQPFGLPVIQGLGTTAGFSLVLQDPSGSSPARLQEVAERFIARAREIPAVLAPYTTFRATVPQVYLEIDREKVMKMGISLADINTALQSITGSTYINDFNIYGKVFKVMLQGDARFRDLAERVKNIYVRNHSGAMVPLRTVVTIKEQLAPQFMTRYNLYNSVVINGSYAPGYSSGDAMAALEKAAEEVLKPAGMSYAWTEMSYQEKLAGNTIVIIMALALLFMYLFLVAQYESFLIPVAVLLAVPIAFFGALLFLKFADQTNNIYTQVGFVLLFGLACKTAILIVEFAKSEHERGVPIAEAALYAAKLRFRAVLMTAISFVLGTMPLVIASGAGAASRRALGTAVFGGMTLSVIFGTLLVPAFYVIMARLADWRKPAPQRKDS